MRVTLGLYDVVSYQGTTVDHSQATHEPDTDSPPKFGNRNQIFGLAQQRLLLSQQAPIRQVGNWSDGWSHQCLLQNPYMYCQDSRVESYPWPNVRGMILGSSGCKYVFKSVSQIDENIVKLLCRRCFSNITSKDAGSALEIQPYV
jgi:hypothetical protein